jgi:hypothetical protein
MGIIFDLTDYFHVFGDVSSSEEYITWQCCRFSGSSDRLARFREMAADLVC